jgi:hypothetical protein
MKTGMLALVAMAAVAADTNWPQFRGPSGGGLGTGSPPAEWNVENAVAPNYRAGMAQPRGGKHLFATGERR